MLQNLADRALAVLRLRLRPMFVRNDLMWPGQSAAVHTLRQRRYVGYMQLVRVDLATFDWIVDLVARTSLE